MLSGAVEVFSRFVTDSRRPVPPLGMAVLVRSLEVIGAVCKCTEWTDDHLRLAAAADGIVPGQGEEAVEADLEELRAVQSRLKRSSLWRYVAGQVSSRVDLLKVI